MSPEEELKMESILIKGGKIIDGTGNPYMYGDILLEGNKIAKVGQTISNNNADVTINAESLCVCPGFTDVHSHSDLALIRNPYANEKLFQGVTTEIVGNCGFSIYPFDEKSEDIIKNYVSPLLGSINKKYKCKNVRDYFNLLENIKTSINVGTLVGHGSIHAMVKGFDKSLPSLKEIKRMKDILEMAMLEGALGMSTGLVYAPGCFSTFDELIELSKMLAFYKGKYVTHLRDQGKNILESIKETIQLSQETNVEIHISHLKVMGINQVGQINNVLKMLKNAVTKGFKVTSDVCPYTSGSSFITRIFPSWILEGGNKCLIKKLKQNDIINKLESNFQEGISGWENLVDLIGWGNIIITSVESNHNKVFEGLNIIEIAKILDLSPVETICKLTIEENGQVMMVEKTIDENDLKTVLQNPKTMIGTDGIHLGSKPHPCLYQTFPRVLGKYVRELGILKLEEAIRKMTSLAADTFGLNKMGVIKPGNYADIVIFDESTIKDTGTYQNPDSLPIGIKYVIVNGQIVIEAGRHTNKRPGRVIRKKIIS